MIQPAPPTLIPAAPPGKTAASNGSDSGEFGSFELSLADFLNAAENSGDASIALPAAPGERHDDAADGNALPLDTDTDVPSPDPALAWLAFPVAPPPPIRPIAFTSAAPGHAIVDASIISAGVDGRFSPGPALTNAPDLPQPAIDPNIAPPPAGHGPDAADPPRVDPVESPAATPSAKPALAKLTLLPTLPTLPTPSTVQALRPDPADTAVGAKAKLTLLPTPIVAPPIANAPPPPAAQTFAAAVRAAAIFEERPTSPRHEENTPITSIVLSPLETRAAAIAATGDVQKAPLDLRQDRWPGALIDRIEALRDSADAADTRIRLIPDALGTIDVSVRKEGDVVHVHFAAEQAATRSILQDAQPRLAELAQARGLKLGQTAVDSGGAGTGQQPSRQPQPIIPLAPARAPTRSEPTDTRIA